MSNSSSNLFPCWENDVLVELDVPDDFDPSDSSRNDAMLVLEQWKRETDDIDMGDVALPDWLAPTRSEDDALLGPAMTPAETKTHPPSLGCQPSISITMVNLRLGRSATMCVHVLALLLRGRSSCARELLHTVLSSSVCFLKTAKSFGSGKR